MSFLKQPRRNKNKTVAHCPLSFRVGDEKKGSPLVHLKSNYSQSHWSTHCGCAAFKEAISV